MSPHTYGAHAEEAAAALNQLILEDRAPIDDDDVEHLLRCRQGSIAALQQRLHGFGLAPAREQTPRPAIDTIRLTGLDTWLTTLVSQIAFDSPAPTLESPIPPSQVLTQRSEDPTVELWRRAAVNLLAGSHTLDVAEDQPWLKDPGAGWYLMRDTAVVAEALVVLDSRLEELGLLPTSPPATRRLSVGERRLIASQCARVATWYSTSNAADRAEVPASRRDRVLAGPIVIVTSPADLAPAQRRLAGFLTPTHANDTAYSGAPEISADGARQLVASQLFLCRVFAEAATIWPAEHQLSAEFAIRHEILREIQPQLRFLVDLQPPEPNRHRVWQQGEITSAVRRLQQDRVALTLTHGQALDLASATHHVVRNLARCLRRELLRNTSNLRIGGPRATLTGRMVAPTSPLLASLTDLICQPPPAYPRASPDSSPRRAALRHTLDLTPCHNDPGEPYPLAMRPAPLVP